MKVQVFRAGKKSTRSDSVRILIKHSSTRLSSSTQLFNPYKHIRKFSNMLANTSHLRASVTSSIVFPVALFAALCTTCNALKMINFDAPDSAFQGDTIHLSCFFTLQNGHQQTLDPSQSRPASKKFKSNLSSIVNDGNSTTSTRERLEVNSKSFIPELSNAVEQLYAVKWYKDEREFFRYLAQDWPRKQALPVEGLFIDVSPLQKLDSHLAVHSKSHMTNLSTN